MAAAVNFPLVWILLGISSLVIFVYKVSTTLQRNEKNEDDKKNFPLTSFVVMIVAVLFFISGQFIGSLIPNRLQISNSEINPSCSKETFSLHSGYEFAKKDESFLKIAIS